MQTATNTTTMPDIPANLRRTADKAAPKTASDVPQPKLAKGNDGVHSKKAVEDNAKKAAALRTAAKPVTAKPSKAAAKADAKAASAKKALATGTPTKGRTDPVVFKDRKIAKGKTPLKAREGTWRHYMVSTALAHVGKTTNVAEAIAAKHKEFGKNKLHWSWMVKEGYITLS